jgi:TonB family protein
MAPGNLTVSEKLHHPARYNRAIMFRLSVAVAAFFSALIPRAASAQADTGQTYLEFQVDQPARVKTPAIPVYPEHLRSAGTDGLVLVQFVVDERGKALLPTFKVLKSNDNAFSEAVKRAVAKMAFHPAEIGGRKVKSIVQQPYRFTARS